MAQYKAAPGLTATLEQDLLVVSWAGQSGSEMRVRYAIDGGQPVVHDLAVRKSGGQWGVLGQNLTPEFRVVSGIRRMSTQQAEPLRAAGVVLTPEVIAKNRWFAFWDAPLVMPDGPEMRDAAAYTAPRAAPDPAAPAGEQRGRGQGAARGPVGAGFDAQGGAGQAEAGGRGRGFDPGGGLPPLPLAGRNIGEPRSADGHPSRERVIQHDVVQREDRRRDDRGDVPGPQDGHLCGRSALHRLSRHEPAPDGGARQDERRVDCLQVRGGPEGILDRADVAGRVARHRRPAAAQRAWRRGQPDNRAGEGAESRARGRRQGRFSRHVHAAAYILLHAREGHEPGLRLVPQGRRRQLRHRHSSAGPRRGSAVRRELRAVQRAARHRAADARVFLCEPGDRRSHPGSGDGVHAQRHVQAGAGLQDVREPLPPRLHRPRSRVRIVRHADAGSGSHAGARTEHHRIERLPLRTARQRPGARSASGTRRITSKPRAARPTRISS